MLSLKPSTEDVADEILQAAIDYTISQDFAAGHSAEQARRLQGFHGEGNSNESTSRIPSGPAFLEASRDYQIQLMLLEQQNKKRLLMARDQADSEELAQRRAEAEELQLSGRKRRKWNPLANNMKENLASTSATTGQITNGLDQASRYEVPSLDKFSVQRTDGYRRSPAIFEFSIRSLVIALTDIATTVQTFSRTRHPQAFHPMVARRRKIRGR